jgi:iron-sulfur cluster repair protein YtfE (RIC family)
MVLARVRDLQHMVKEKHTLYPIISSRQPKDIVEWVGKQINV